MKKVLFIGPSFYDFKNKGSVLHLKEKFEGLVGAGIKPYVLACGRPFRKKMWGAEFFLFPHKLWFFQKAFQRGFWICVFKKIDTIIAQSPLYEGWLGAGLKKLLRKELIIEVHGDWDAVFLVKKRSFEKLKKWLVKRFVKASFKNADKVRVVADYLDKKARVSAPNTPFFKFATFTDLSIFLSEQDISFQKYILFVGGLYKIKGAEYLIEAFAKISHRFPGFKLVMVGKGPELANLQTQALNLNIQDKVEFKGQVSLEQVKELMKNCYCLVLPSLSEGLPRVALEAMALAKPVIASNVGGIPEIVKDNQTGLLFQKQNTRDLEEKIKKMLGNQGITKSMGANARQMIKSNFSTKNYIQEYQKMIFASYR